MQLFYNIFPYLSIGNFDTYLTASLELIFP